ncbi:MAG: ferritin-like domain-containing protein [Candidatus Zixiibacteriota bacterium]
MEEDIKLLRASDIIKFAISAEENQHKFYSRAADIVQNRDLYDTFIFLADEEKQHKKHFQGMLKVIDTMDFDKALPEGYFEFLNTLLRDITFIANNFETILSRIKTAEHAISFAINHEAEFLLYYIELRSMVPGQEQIVIDKIISEERNHFTMLSAIKSKLYLVDNEGRQNAEHQRH